jgi:hypothetical protein
MVDFAYSGSFEWSSMEVLETDDVEMIADKLDNLLDILIGADSWIMPVLVSEVEDQIQ